MSSKCVAPGCKNYTSSKKGYAVYNKENGISFHRFPNLTEEKKKWEEALSTSMGVPNWTSLPRTIICSDHFLNSDFAGNGWSVKRCLLPGAAPTILEFTVRQPASNERRTNHRGPTSLLKEAQQEPDARNTQQEADARNILTTHHSSQPQNEDIIKNPHHLCPETAVYSPVRKRARIVLAEVEVENAACITNDCVDTERPAKETVASSASLHEESSLISKNVENCTTFEEFKSNANHCSTPGAPDLNRKRCHRSLFSISAANKLCLSTYDDIPSLPPHLFLPPASVDSSSTSDSLKTSFQLNEKLLLEEEDDTPRKKKLKTLLASCYAITGELGTDLNSSQEEVKVLKTDNEQMKTDKELLENQNKQLLVDIKILENTRAAEAIEKKKIADVLAKEKLSTKTLKRKIKCLKLKMRRCEIKLNNVQEYVQHLQENKLVSTDALEMLEKAITPGAASMLKRVKTEDNKLNRGKHNEYPPCLRAFALTLHFYSPRAYNYIRNSFNKALPCKKTLQGWMSHVSAGPGFSQEALDTISSRVKEAEKEGKVVKIALSTDEISLKEGVHFDGHRVTGYVDLGPDEDGNITIDTTETKANHACTFMAVSINDHWKLPVGYFLVKSLTGPDRAALAKECILKIEATGAQVECLTFDGTACNWSMAKELGAKISNVENLSPSFPNPADPTRDVCTMLDTCHMVKLVRNCLAEKGIFYDGQKRAIRWSYLEELHALQTTEGLKLANKLAKRHINWKRHKMKVRVAVQTFSSSVADALEYCEKVLMLPQFEGAQATVDFIRKIDKLFDILNSSSPFATYLKAPLKPANIDERSEFLNDVTDYIKKITVTNVGGSILDTVRKTGFLGLIIGAKCVLDLYDRLVKGGTMKYLLTYKLSQDHLEMFFSLIRQRGGWNNNPMCHQFQAAYKSLLLHNEIKHVASGNCITQSIQQLLTVSSRNKIVQEPTYNTHVPEGPLARFRFREEDGDVHSVLIHQRLEHDYDIPDFEVLSRYCEDVVEYVAGFVVRSLEKSVHCYSCRQSMFPSGDDDGEAVCSYSLIRFKDRGGLVVPSRDVVKICKFTEQCFREASSENLNSVLAMKIPHRVVLFARENSVFACLGDHIKNLGPFNNHFSDLVYSIVNQFLKVRLHHSTRQLNAAKDDIRSVYNRLVIDQHM